MTTFSVSTEERTYNSVDSVQQFIKIRKNWGDWSEIQSVHEWKNGQGWVKRDSKEWVETEM